MNKKVTAFAFAFFCVASIPSAHGQINDPQNILDRVDQFLGKPDFATSFHTSDTLLFMQKDCVGAAPGKCDTRSLKMVVEANDTLAKFTYYGGDQPTHEALTKDIWNENSGNALRAYLARQASFSFQVTIQSVREATAGVTVNDSCQLIDVLEVTSTAINQTGLKLDDIISVAKQPGLAQIVRIRETQTGLIPSSKDYQLKSFHR